MGIHLGREIHEKVLNSNLTKKQIMTYFRCSDSKVNSMYHSEHMKSDLIMKWSILLDFDFFQFFSSSFIKYKKYNKKYDKKDDKKDGFIY